MQLIKNIKRVTNQFPRTADFAYRIMQKYWGIKSNYVNYEFPVDKEKSDISLDQVKEYNKNRFFGPKKRLCYAPFNNMHFTINGLVYACCFSFDYFIGDINKNSIKEIWFGEKAEIFRNTLSDYNLQKCVSCKSIFNAQNYNAFPPNKYDLYADDSTLYPTQMSFEISNLCNLECIMCDGNFSSLIRKNREKLAPLTYKYPKDFADQLKEFIPHLKIATFIGGEPLLIKQYYEIWEEIIKNNPTCVIHIQTNATVITSQFLKLLETGQFEIGISIDAITKEVYDKIRVNANYDEVRKNIETFINFQNRGKTYLNFNFCPLISNWFELPNMIEFANQNNIVLKILNVDVPYHLTLKQQKTEVLIEVLDRLLKCNFKPALNQKRNIDSFNSFIENLKYLIKESVERELFLEEHNALDLKSIIQKFNDEIHVNMLFEKYGEEDKNCFKEENIKNILSLTDNRNVQKRILIRNIHHLKSMNSESNTMRSVNEILQNQRNINKSLILLENQD